MCLDDIIPAVRKFEQDWAIPALTEKTTDACVEIK